MKNIHGFSSIEFMAVIVIVSIFLAISVPKINQYIRKSRIDSFVTTSKNLVDEVRDSATGGLLDYLTNVGDVTIISLDLINSSNKTNKTAFYGDIIPQYSYVAIINVGTDEDPEFEYYIAVRDSKGYNISLTNEKLVSNDSVIRDYDDQVEITPICGTKDGSYQTIDNIVGLEQYRLSIGWNAIVYSTVECQS